MQAIYYARMDSPVGPLLIAASERGVLAVEFDGQAQPAWIKLAKHVAECARQLREYFAGQLRQFTVPLDLRGTDFQKRCWQELLKIPYGETRTYAEIARAVGSPHGFRAVGMANHDNPVAIIVPCHRVIASNGGLAGYGGGLHIKKWLLDLEKTQALLNF